MDDDKILVLLCYQIFGKTDLSPNIVKLKSEFEIVLFGPTSSDSRTQYVPQNYCTILPNAQGRLGEAW